MAKLISKIVPVKSKAVRMLGETSGHTNAEGPGAPAHFAAMKKQ